MWSIEAIQMELLKVSKVAHIEVSKAPFPNEELAASKRSTLLLKSPSLVEKVLHTAEDLVEFDPPLKRVLARWLAGDEAFVGGHNTKRLHFFFQPSDTNIELYSSGCCGPLTTCFCRNPPPWLRYSWLVCLCGREGWL